MPKLPKQNTVTGYMQVCKDEGNIKFLAQFDAAIIVIGHL